MSEGGSFFAGDQESPSRNLLRRSSSASGGTRDAAGSADLAGIPAEVRGERAKGFKKTNLRKITSQVDYEDLDSRMCCEYFCDQWAHNHDPAAEFAHFIDGLSIGVENPKAAKILGSLKRHEGSFTGADVLYVTFDEPITLSWLQWALHAAGEPSNVRQL